MSRIFRPGPGHRQAVSQGRHQRHEKHPAQVPRGPLRRGQPRLGSFTVDFKSFSIFQALHMIMLSASSLSFTKDMMEEQIISTEEADLKTRTTESSLQLLGGQVYESRDNRPGAADCYKEVVSTDLTCVKAMTLLTSHQMLTLEEERDLMQSLALLCSS